MVIFLTSNLWSLVILDQSRDHEHSHTMTFLPWPAGCLFTTIHEGSVRKQSVLQLLQKGCRFTRVPQCQSLIGDRLVNSDIFNLLSKMSMLKGINVKVSQYIVFPVHLVFKNLCSYIKFIASVQGHGPAMYCYPSMVSRAGWLS